MSGAAHDGVVTDNASTTRPEPVDIGVDIGGTGTRFVALGVDGRVRARRSVATPPAPLSAHDAGMFFRDAIRELLGSALTLSAVGIGVSGPVLAGGRIENPHTLPAFSGLRLAEVVADALGVPVAVQSDAVAAAIAEASVGAGAGAGALLHVTIGTGIGAAFIRGGVALLGADGIAPEAGHLDLADPSAPACYCGRAHCWEQAASRRALQRRAGVTDLAGLDSLAAATGEPGADGDRARTIFDDYGRALGLGLRNLVQVLRPDRIVLGGGGARWFASYRAALFDTLREVDVHGLGLDVRASTLDDDGGAIGAALLAGAQRG